MATVVWSGSEEDRSRCGVIGAEGHGCRATAKSKAPAAAAAVLHGERMMLEPFVHQVGGHSCILCFGEQTICKPLFPHEQQFYKSLPAALRRFTPQYHGVVSVSLEEDEIGNIRFMAYPLQSDPAADLENKDPLADSEPKSEMLKWGETMSSSLLVDCENYSEDSRNHHSHKDKDESVHKLEEDVELEWLQQSEMHYYRLEWNHSNSVSQLKQKPWIRKSQQHCLQRMKVNSKHHNQHKFILLENLTWRHTMPCVLDLKIGTKHYGDNPTEEQNVFQSTASSIRVYLVGMQVYQSDTGQLTFMSKIHGRRLTVPDFKETLFQFFHTGRRLRHELLPLVVHRLREIQAAVEACESYRFSSSSLLIIYEGASPKTHTRQHTEDGLSKEDEDEDEEAEAEPEMEEEEEVGEVAGAFGFPHSPSTSSDGSSSSEDSSVSQSCLSCSDPHNPMVDVRMIDFAHATCRNFQDDGIVYEGPDSNYLFGLQNLISIISELKNHRTDYRPTLSDLGKKRGRVQTTERDSDFSSPLQN